MQSKINFFLKKEIAIILLFILIDLIFFWKYFFNGLIPIPADLIIGGYYPWLNEKWGYIVGVPVKNPLMSDVVSLLYPWRKLAIDLIKSGQLPLWDSTSFLGTTLIGNFQVGILNPFNLLFFLPFDFNKVWGFQVVIQPFIAMISMYIMLRNWKLSKLPSIFGAISFAFSAQIIVWVEYNAQGFIIAVFPLLIYLIDKYLVAEKIKYLTGISLIFGYIIFVGYPQQMYYFAFFGFIYFAFFLLQKRNLKNLILKSLIFISFVFLGLCLSGVILLPGLESLNLSIKNLDNVAAQNSVLFLPWQNLITAFAPDYFGNPATNNYYGIGHYESLIFYTSILTLPFAAVAAAGKLKKPHTIICLIFLISALTLALKSPVSELIQNMNLLGLRGSVSSRILFMYGFALSALCAIGIERFKTEGFLKDKLYLKYLPIISLLAILIGAGLSLLFIKLGIGDLGLIKTDLEKIIISLKNLILPLGLAFVTSIIIFAGRFINKKVLILILLGLLLFDYFRFSSKYLPFLEASKIFPTTPTISFLENQPKPFRIAIQRAELLPANTWSVYNIESISGYNILLPKDTADYISFLNNQQISEGYARFIDIGNFSSKLLDLANIEYLVVVLRKDGIADEEGTPPYDLDLKKYELVFKEGATAIYKNKNFINRFYSPENLLAAKSPFDTYQILNSSNFDLKKTAVLNENPEKAKLSQCILSNLQYNSQKITLSTNCPQEGFLAFSQVFYPGWNAYINNQKTQILKTNGIFSGLKLPPGNSEILIEYLPRSFKYGIYLSLISLLTLVTINSLSLMSPKRLKKPK